MRIGQQFQKYTTFAAYDKYLRVQHETLRYRRQEKEYRPSYLKKEEMARLLDARRLDSEIWTL